MIHRLKLISMTTIVYIIIQILFVVYKLINGYLKLSATKVKNELKRQKENKLASIVSEFSIHEYKHYHIHRYKQ